MVSVVPVVLLLAEARNVGLSVEEDEPLKNGARAVPVAALRKVIAASAASIRLRSASDAIKNTTAWPADAMICDKFRIFKN